MPRCPKCGKEIDSLKHYQTCLVKWDFYIDENVNEYFENEDMLDGWDSKWACPECDETLFFDIEDAINFLKGNKKEEK
jgi:hypothetical protein